MRAGPSSNNRRAWRTQPVRTLPLLFLSFLLPLLGPETSPAQSEQLTAVEVTPATLTLAPLATRQFVATAVYNTGRRQDITAVADWTTGDSKHAEVSTAHGSRGLVTAGDPGTVEIRASLQHGTSRTRGIANLTVYAGPLVSIFTKPTTKNVELGINAAFKARGLYQNGYEADLTKAVTWTSSNTAVATISNTAPNQGIVTPKALGTTVIRAKHVPTNLQNTVEDGTTKVLSPITRIEFDQRNLTLGIGMKSDLRVYGYRADGSRSNISEKVDYSMSAPGVIAISNQAATAGEVTALANGTVTVNANDPVRNLNTAGKSASVQVAGTLVSLEVRPNPFRVAIGELRNPQAIGILSSGLETPDLRRRVNWQTTHPAIASVSTISETYGAVQGHQLGATQLRATEPSTGKVSAPVPVTVQGQITSVSIEPKEIRLGRNMKLPLSARGNRSNGSDTDISSSVEWAISPPTIGTIDEDGVLATLSVNGSATIRATIPGGLSSSDSGNDATLTVEGQLVGLAVEPELLRVQLDIRRRAQAIGKLSTGADTNDLREVVDWSVANPAVAQVGTGVVVPGEEDPLDRGELVGIETGRTTLTAREPVTGITSTEVDNVQVVGEILGIELEPGNDGLVPLTTPTLYKVRATFSDQSTGNVSDKCTWTIDDASVALVDNTLPGKGLITGLIQGERTTVRVDCDGLRDDATVRVVGDEIALEVDPATFRGTALRTKRFRAAAIYEEGEKADVTNESTWSSTNPIVAKVDPEEPGRVKFLSDGVATIFAVSPLGHIGMCDLTVVGGVTEIRISPNRATIRGSNGRQLLATAQTSDNQRRLVTKDVIWSSDNEDVVRLSEVEGEEGLLLSANLEGTAIITATLGDVEATAEIRVKSLLESIQLRPDRRIITVGQNRRVTALGQYDDGDSRPMTPFVEFSSTNPAVAEVLSHGNEAGKVTALAPGIAKIKATDPSTGIVSSETEIEVVAAE